MSPTQRSLKLLRKEGWLCDVVEHWNPWARKRKDMFGLFDIVACAEGECQFVQTTSATNASARIKKIKDHKDFETLAGCGASLIVHGWHKVKNRWKCKIFRLT